MTPERQQQIKQVFHAVRECTPEARGAYLDEVRRKDDALGQEVASLLLAYEDLGDFMQQPVLAMPQKPEPTIEQLALTAGQQVGHYQIEHQLGAGGMGVVYLARDTRLGRLVTLKLLPPRFTKDRDRMRRFQQEARAASALNHPNLLTIYEVGQMDADADGTFYIVAEYVTGLTLRELFRDDTMQLGKVLDLVLQLTDAIAVAHQAGIVHRDIKPENVMLRPDGIVKVLDFGLAKLTEHAERPPAPNFTTVTTQPGLVMGTVAYMSPEQARGKEVDARSDLFSIGAVLYELLTGRKPFQGETQSDVLAALLEREPPPLTYYVAGLPSALQLIVTRALAKPLPARFQTAQEFGQALRQLKNELEFAAQLSRSVEKESSLHLKVGTGAPDDNEVTQVISGSVSLKSSLNFLLSGFNYSRRVTFFAAACFLLLVGMFAGRHLWRDSKPALNSIAVLPFINVGNDPQKEYLPDAITENLIDSLSRLPSLRVSSRSTVFGYKGRAMDPRQAGKELQVGGVLTGRVEWQGEKLIVQTELVDTTNGSRLWGEVFQQTRADILTTQGVIVREIAAKLHRRLSPESEQQLIRRHTEDSAAYELYAQGRYLHSQYGYEPMNKALDSFRRAITRAPQYALAYCGIADVYADMSSQYIPPGEAMPKAREAALKALELDEKLPEAHHSLALVKLWGDWDWAGAEREFQRALELNPGLALTRMYYAEMLLHQKRFEEALHQIRLVEESDPVSTLARTHEGIIYYGMRQYEQAVKVFRKILELNPNNRGIQRQLALALSTQERHQEAIALITQLAPDSSIAQLQWLAYIYAHAGQRGEALKLLAALKVRAAQEPVSPTAFAAIYVGLGDKEQALAWLHKAYAEQSDHLKSIGIDPMFDPLRNDPQFIEILRGIGLQH